jgi:hypothetical protein
MSIVQLTQKNRPGSLQLAKAVIDIAETGTLTAADVVKTGVFIPEGALLVRAWYHVHTTFTGGGADAATIKLGTTSNDDNMVAAIAISAANPGVWDEGARGTLIGADIMATVAGDTAILAAARTAAAMVAVTVDEEILMTTGANTVTDGKMTIYVEYVQTGKLA